MRTIGLATALALGGLLALPACGGGNVPRGDLAAAQSLGAAASTARDKYAQLANDYQASCERSYRWRHLVTAEVSHAAKVQSNANRAAAAKLMQLSSQLAKRAAAGDASAAQLRSIVAELRTQTASYAAALPVAPDICGSASIVAAVTAWNDWNNLLLTYFIGLGTLAAPPKADAFGLSEAATAIAKSPPGGESLPQQPAQQQALQKQQQALQNEANAMASLATAALSIGIEDREADAVAKYSTGTIATVVDNDIAALQTVAQIYIDSALTTEADDVDLFYLNNLDLVPGGTPILGSLQDFLKSWSADLEAVSAKRSAAQAYIASLKALQASYSAVGKAASQHQGPSDLVATATMLYNQLSPSLTAVDKAFAPATSPASSSPQSSAPKKGKK